jgi:hypothetical protein
VELVRIADSEAVAGVRRILYELYNMYNFRKRRKDEAAFNDARNLALLRLEQWQADFRYLHSAKTS